MIEAVQFPMARVKWCSVYWSFSGDGKRKVFKSSISSQLSKIRPERTSSCDQFPLPLPDPISHQLVGFVILRDPMTSMIANDERLVRIADLEQLLGSFFEHVLCSHDMARRHVDYLPMFFGQPCFRPIRRPRRRADEEDAAAKVAPRLLGLAGLEIVNQQGCGDGGAFRDADDAVERALVFDDVVKVFQRYSHAPGLWRVVYVFREEEREQLVIYGFFFSCLAPPASFGGGETILADVGFVPDIEEARVPLEEFQVWGAVKGYF